MLFKQTCSPAALVAYSENSHIFKNGRPCVSRFVCFWLYTPRKHSPHVCPVPRMPFAFSGLCCCFLCRIISICICISPMRKCQMPRTYCIVFHRSNNLAFFLFFFFPYQNNCKSNDICVPFVGSFNTKSIIKLCAYWGEIRLRCSSQIPVCCFFPCCRYTIFGLLFGVYV